MPPEALPFSTRLWFAFVCWARVLFDASFARGAWSVAHGGHAGALPAAEGAPPALTAPTPTSRRADGPPSRESTPATVKSTAPPPAPTPALQLLALFQREGRFVDFLEEDVAGFTDADIGAAARVVHEGCRRALREHIVLEPVRPEDEGKRVALGSSPPPDEVKLVGNVQGHGPFEGVLRHRGWRVRSLNLPALIGHADATIIAPAEIEL